MKAVILRYVISGVVIFLAGVLAGWITNGWRLGREIAKLERDQEQQRLEFQVQARATEHQWQARLKEANDAAAKREQALRADADSANRATAGLQRKLADYERRLPELTADAVRQYAATLGDVFGECTERYTAVAEKAGGHASDVRKLMDAWPR